MDTCEHVIGMVFDYDNTRLVSLVDLKWHIKDNERRYNSFWTNQKPYTLSDYADKRKCTDMTRFDYCPFCGTMIDWKAIKKEG